MSDETFYHSHRAMVERLQVGESYCICRKLMLGEITGNDVSQAERDLQNSARGLIARAEKVVGSKYTGEYGHWHTSRGHNPVVCFLITRTK